MSRPMKPTRPEQHYILTGGRCQTTGKRVFLSRSDAKNAARRAMSNGEGRMRPYACDCGYWHIGHLPKAVKAGDGWWSE